MDAFSLLWSVQALVVFLVGLVDGRPARVGHAIVEGEDNDVLTPSPFELHNDDDMFEGFDPHFDSVHPAGDICLWNVC